MLPIVDSIDGNLPFVAKSSNVAVTGHKKLENKQDEP